MDWDQITNYSQTDLKPCKQPVDKQSITVTTKRGPPLPEYLAPFFNKDKFDYLIMFTEVPERGEGVPEQIKIPMHGDGTFLQQINQTSFQKQEQNMIEDVDQQREQERQSQREEIQGDNQPILKDILKQQQKVQEQSQSQQIKMDHQMQEEKQENIKKQQGQQGLSRSEIDNFSLQIHNAQQIAQRKYNNQSQSFQQYNGPKDNGIVHQIMSPNLLQISEIKQNKEVNQADQQQRQDNNSNKQQLSQAQKQQITNKLKEQQFKHLKYRISTQNCQKITIKTIIDPYGNPTKLKQLQPNNIYLTVQKKKITIPSYNHDNLIWQFGTSKRQIVPGVVHINCYSCRVINKCQLQTQTRFCSTICKNQSCTKNITFEIVEIVLQ